jgi:hypothetical protein
MLYLPINLSNFLTDISNSSSEFGFITRSSVKRNVFRNAYTDQVFIGFKIASFFFFRMGTLAYRPTGSQIVCCPTDIDCGVDLSQNLCLRRQLSEMKIFMFYAVNDLEPPYHNNPTNF